MNSNLKIIGTSSANSRMCGRYTLTNMKEVKKKNREKGPCWVYTIAEQREGWDVTMLTIMNKMLLFISTTKLLIYMY